jgi:hypothetical protein
VVLAVRVAVTQSTYRKSWDNEKLFPANNLILSSSCSGQSTQDIYIGYYEGWNSQRLCDVVLPEDINVAPWTVC